MFYFREDESLGFISQGKGNLSEDPARGANEFEPSVKSVSSFRLRQEFKRHADELSEVFACTCLRFCLVCMCVYRAHTLYKGNK